MGGWVRARELVRCGEIAVRVMRGAPARYETPLRVRGVPLFAYTYRSSEMVPSCHSANHVWVSLVLFRLPTRPAMLSLRPNKPAMLFVASITLHAILIRLQRSISATELAPTTRFRFKTHPLGPLILLPYNCNYNVRFFLVCENEKKDNI